jgi:hypothetical protein
VVDDIVTESAQKSAPSIGRQSVVEVVTRASHQRVRRKPSWLMRRVEGKGIRIGEICLPSLSPPFDASRPLLHNPRP